MTILVLCDTSGHKKSPLMRAKELTPVEYRKNWRRAIVDGVFDGPYSMLAWTGSVDQFVLFKLSENTGLIIAHAEKHQVKDVWDKFLEIRRLMKRKADSRNDVAAKIVNASQWPEIDGGTDNVFDANHAALIWLLSTIDYNTNNLVEQFIKNARENKA